MKSKTLGIFVALCVGCSVRTARSVLLDVSTEMEEADRLWRERASHGLDAAVQALEFDDAGRADHPDVLWRKVRVLTALGQASSSSEEALEYYGQARAAGLACLEGAPAFRLRKAEWGWVDAIQFIPPRRAACAATLGVAWVRWLAEIGPVAGAADLEVLDGLLTWSEEQPQPVTSGYGAWGRALLFGVRGSEDGRDLEASRQGLDRAMTNPILPQVLVESDYVRWACEDETAGSCEVVRARLEAKEAEAPDVAAARRDALAHSRSGQP